MKTKLNLFLVLCIFSLSCQTRKASCDHCKEEPYTSYFTGNEDDLSVSPNFGITMMGGRSEHDQAMKWFLQQANGGDILVLRSSGSDGYNNYLFSELGVRVNSVETLVIDNAKAANHEYVQDKIKKAEAIWMAGGNQFNYVNIWGNSPMKELLNDHINKKKGVIGGTSAGMAVLGEWYYSAAEGSVNSDQALNNPYHRFVTLENDFLKIPILKNTITDTHYGNRSRQGRHSSFIGRIVKEQEKRIFGIACDEYTAINIGDDGIANIYGNSPQKEDAVYFIQASCHTGFTPEKCQRNSPLTWDREHAALTVYKVIANSEGSQTFNLNDWQTGKGGEWLNWYIDSGKWYETAGTALNCN